MRKVISVCIALKKFEQNCFCKGLKNYPSPKKCCPKTILKTRLDELIVKNII